MTRKERQEARAERFREYAENAAKFLREELGADLVVSPKFNSKTGDRIGYFWRWSQRTDKIDNKTYRTFEAALSAGISVVLEPFKEYFNGKN